MWCWRCDPGQKCDRGLPRRIWPACRGRIGGLLFPILPLRNSIFLPSNLVVKFNIHISPLTLTLVTVTLAHSDSFLTSQSNTEPSKKAFPRLREFLPAVAWVVHSKTEKPFCGALYSYIQMFGLQWHLLTVTLFPSPEGVNVIGDLCINFEHTIITNHICHSYIECQVSLLLFLCRVSTQSL